MNRTSEIGEDANITVFLKERKMAVGRTAHTKLCVFFYLFLWVHTFLLPPLHQTGIYHWESSLSVSQGYPNTKVTLKKKRLSIQGNWKRIPMELPITSILKQNPCKPSHHGNHRPWWENCQVLLRLQLRPHQKKMCLYLQVSGLEVGRIAHSIRLPHRISSPFPTSGGKNLVGGPRQEGKWYINLEEENNSMFTFWSHDLEENKLK